jgi:colanic acid biosynthesis glycosyl transferase WcaI
MRILLVTQYFWPENFRINDLVEGLLDSGHSVTVLAGVPNYPSGKIEPGYGYFNFNAESFKGADVKRVPMLTRGKGSGLHLALNYLSFALSASLLGPWLCRGQQFDCIFVYGLSPTTVAIPGMVLKWFKRKPMVMWVQDLWPESLEATGFVKNQTVIDLVRRMVRMIYSSCDRILLSSRSFIPAVLNIHNQPEKLHYFPQWAEGFYGPRPRDASFRDQLARGRSFCLTFAGNIGTAQDVETILECATLLQDHPGISFSLLGDGSMRAWLEQEIIKRGLNNIACLGSFPSNQMPDFFAASDVLLVSLKKNPLYALTVPAKVQSYLACGLPILASLDGEGAQIVAEAQVGLVCKPEDPKAMRDAVLELYHLAQERPEALSLMGENGLKYTDQFFSRARLLGDLIDHFQFACSLRIP